MDGQRLLLYVPGKRISNASGEIDVLKRWFERNLKSPAIRDVQFWAELFRECVHCGMPDRLLRVAHIINQLDPVRRHVVHHIAANAVGNAEAATQSNQTHSIMTLDNVLRFHQLREVLRFVNKEQLTLANIYEALRTWNWNRTSNAHSLVALFSLHLLNILLLRSMAQSPMHTQMMIIDVVDLLRRLRKVADEASLPAWLRLLSVAVLERTVRLTTINATPPPMFEDKLNEMFESSRLQTVRESELIHSTLSATRPASRRIDHDITLTLGLHSTREVQLPVLQQLAESIGCILHAQRYTKTTLVEHMRFIASHSQLLTMNELTQDVVTSLVELVHACSEPEGLGQLSSSDASALRDVIEQGLLLLVVWLRMVHHLDGNDAPAPWRSEDVEASARAIVQTAKRALRVRAVGSRVLAVSLMALGAAVGIVDQHTSHSCVGIIQNYMLKAGASVVYVSALLFRSDFNSLSPALGMFLTAALYVLEAIPAQQLRAFTYILLRLWNAQLNLSDNEQVKQKQREKSLQNKHLLFISKMFSSLFQRKSKMTAAMSARIRSTPFLQWFDIVSRAACDELNNSQARMLKLAD